MTRDVSLGICYAESEFVWPTEGVLPPTDSFTVTINLLCDPVLVSTLILENLPFIDGTRVSNKMTNISLMFFYHLFPS
jgi:hypothetical protein